MVSDLLLRFPLGLACFIPASLIVAALCVTRRSPFAAASVVSILTVELSLVAVTLHALLANAAPAPDETEIEATMRSMVQLDLVSCTMLVLVCTLAVVVVRYSRRYLAGEADLVRYVRSLLLTVAAVTMLVISNHLGLLVACWLATGIGLHQLLTFYRRRRQAVIVAHKEFLLSRIADLCFFASLWLVQHEIGSLHIDVVNAYAQARESLSPSLHLAMVILVFGVFLKTAQLPFHGWILQVMEAPTPVSALLHAGVVNIGGYVMIRLAPIMARATIAQDLLLTVGLITAIVGSLAMTTRASIKMALAWSTIAQMGFMLVQCGLGAWHLALLHLVAHSLYKAHSFLNAGGVVETWRGGALVRSRKPRLRLVALAAAIVALGAAPFYVAVKMSPLHASTSLAALALPLGLSFVPMLARGLAGGTRAFARAALLTLGATAVYLALHALSERAGPSLEGGSPFKWMIVVVGLVALFIAQTILQVNPSGRLGRLLQPHLRSGLYIDEWFTRLTFRLWPPQVDRQAATARRSSVNLGAR